MKNKNIHVLPTDKPSRLLKSQDNVFILLDTYAPNWFEINLKTTKQNIYITSDEEIKTGDWYKSGKFIWQMKYPQWGEEGQRDAKKIILTTDEDLIKDGVQAIDEEFLEWFVKNPNCEKVGIVVDKKLSSKSIYDAVEGDLVYSHHGYGGIINSLSKDVRVGIDNYIETAITSETGWETLDINNYKIYDKCYKIIIPKEELTFENSIDNTMNIISIANSMFGKKEEPKQELKIGDNTNFGIITDIKEYSVCFGKNKIGVDIWYKKSDVKLEPKQETLEEVPTELESVLAKITHQNDLGLSQWYEVVYYDNKWCSYSGSKTFEDGEKVVEWKYCKNLI